MPIKLTMQKQFGPFTALNCPELPDFVVLTGDNASGKTQLLKGIVEDLILVESDGVSLQKQDSLLISGALTPQLQLVAKYDNAFNIERNAINRIQQWKGARDQRSKDQVAQMNEVKIFQGAGPHPWPS